MHIHFCPRMSTFNFFFPFTPVLPASKKQFSALLPKKVLLFVKISHIYLLTMHILLGYTQNNVPILLGPIEKEILQ